MTFSRQPMTQSILSYMKLRIFQPLIQQLVIAEKQRKLLKPLGDHGNNFFPKFAFKIALVAFFSQNIYSASKAQSPILRLRANCTSID